MSLSSQRSAIASVKLARISLLYTCLAAIHLSLGMAAAPAPILSLLQADRSKAYIESALTLTTLTLLHCCCTGMMLFSMIERCSSFQSTGKSSQRTLTLSLWVRSTLAIKGSSMLLLWVSHPGAVCFMKP